MKTVYCWFLSIIFVSVLTVDFGVGFTAGYRCHKPPVVWNVQEKAPVECQDVTFAVTRQSYVQLNVNGLDGTSWLGCGTEGVWKGRAYILTARHVVHEALSIEVQTPGMKKNRRGACIAEDEKNDLGLVWVDLPRKLEGLPPLSPVQSVEVGEDCWYTSSGSGVFNWSERGTVACDHFNSLFIREADVTLVTGMGWFGSSGGGVWVKRPCGYRLCGVVSHGTANTPRCPVGCPSGEEIHKFLEKYIP